MNVLGHEISEDIQTKCWNVLPGEFRAALVQKALADLGVPNGYSGEVVAYRAADRLLQKWRREGLIVYDNRLWRKKSETAW